MADCVQKTSGEQLSETNRVMNGEEVQRARMEWKTLQMGDEATLVDANNQLKSDSLTTPCTVTTTLQNTPH